MGIGELEPVPFGCPGQEGSEFGTVGEVGSVGLVNYTPKE